MDFTKEHVPVEPAQPAVSDPICKHTEKGNALQARYTAGASRRKRSKNSSLIGRRQPMR